MSVPFLPGSFKSKTDRDEKLRYYNSLLKFRSRLNTQNEAYSQIIQEQMEEGTPSTPSPYVPLEERLADINFQRQQAITNTNTVLRPDEATAFVSSYLTTLDELVLYNQRFNEFFRKKLENIRFITPLFLNQQWEQYKASLPTTAERGTEIETPETTTETPFQQNLEIIKETILEADDYNEYKTLLQQKIPSLGRQDAYRWLGQYGRMAVGGTVPRGSEALFNFVKQYLEETGL
jgi:hypothetical protein